MTAKYSVVQFVPDPITDERINVGVIAWDGEKIVSRFIDNWRRVQSFGGGNLSFLRDFSRQFQMLTSPQLRLALGDNEALDARRLESIIGKWDHGIQFTEPHGSTKNADALLADMASTFLRESAFREPAARHRTRRTAASIAAKVLFDMVQHRIDDDASNFVKRNAIIEGSREQHKFDVVLANGKAFAAVHALSFEANEPERLEQAVNATCWLITDVRRKHREMPIGIFVLPPNGPSPTYDRARELFPALRGEIIPENRMQAWARRQSRIIAEHVAPLRRIAASD